MERLTEFVKKNMRADLKEKELYEETQKKIELDTQSLEEKLD